MTRGILWILAGVFALFGLGYLVMPEPFATAAGIQASATGLTDVRATYGGFQLGFAAFLAWSAWAPSRHATALLATGAVVGAIGACRLLGLAIDAAPSRFHAMALAFEIPITLLSLGLYRRERSAAAGAVG